MILNEFEREHCSLISKEPDGAIPNTASLGSGTDLWRHKYHLWYYANNCTSVCANSWWVIYRLNWYAYCNQFSLKGFIGDIIGYRVVLVFNVIMTALCATSFIYLPVYKELEQIPHALLYMNASAAESADQSYHLMSVKWSICQDTFSAGNWYTVVLSSWME